MTELILRGGRVVDPGRGVDMVADIAFAGGRVEAIGPGLPAGQETVIRDVAGHIVTPGLIDLHAHVYWGGTSLGVDPGAVAAASGTTTLVDAGSAGPGTFHGFRRFIVEPAPVRVLAYLNASYAGIFAFGRTVMVGESQDLRMFDLDECVRVAEANRDILVGIKIRVGRTASGGAGAAPFEMALEVAEAVDMPLMAHLDHPPPSRHEVLPRMRSGDVLTHCFRPFPGGPALPRGGVRPEVLEARARGVLFDVGHGGGSFGFASARAMLDAGFLPDTISSDVHVLSIVGLAPHVLDTMSKFVCLGMEIVDVVRCATVAPARAIRRPELGVLAPGGPGDATVIEVEKGDFVYRDVVGERLDGRWRLACRGMVVGGAWRDPVPLPDLSGPPETWF
ncbi:MAG: amidohydrolase/deacetylase family metallohydrolase [Alphaproteobacteria bacterium]